MYEKIAIIGRLGGDPILRQTGDGKEVCNFNVAVNKKSGNKEITKWFQVAAWDNHAEPCSKYLKKGSLVFAEGTVSARGYIDDNGEARATLQMNANVIKFLSTKGFTEGAAENGNGNEGYDDDDIPF